MVLAPSRSLLSFFLTFRPHKRHFKPYTGLRHKCTLQSLCEPLHTVITQCHIQGYTYRKVTSQHHVRQEAGTCYCAPVVGLTLATT